MTEDKSNLKLCNYILWYMLYSFVGWIYESAFCSLDTGELVNRGSLYGPYIPIYGTCSMIVILLFSKVKSKIKIFFYGMLVTSVIEYTVSWVLELIFHKRWWDYSDYFFNLNGRICLLAAVAFGFMCVALVFYVHPRVMSLTARLSRRVKVVSAVVLLAVIFVDCGFTLVKEIKHLNAAAGVSAAASLF